MNKPAGIHVLYIDGEPDVAKEATDMLTHEDNRFTVETIPSISESLDRLDTADFDCIVSKYQMPGQNGIELLETVREEYPELPFILYTANGTEAIAAEAISLGVTDYLQKDIGTDQYTTLANRIINAVESYQSHQLRPDRNQDLLRYEWMVNSMQEAACIYDEDGRFELVNEYLAEWYGTTREALRGESSNLIVHVREEAVDADPFQELLDGQRDKLTGELAAEFPRHGYAVLEYQLTPLLVKGSVEGVVGVARDITGRKTRTQEIHRTKRAMDKAPVGITITDPQQADNPVIYANNGFRTLTGYTDDEILGRNCRFLQGEDTESDPINKIRTAIEKEEPVTVHLRNYRKDGTEFWNRVSIAPVRDDTGSVINFVGFQHDITDHKQRELELERARDLLDQTERIADVGGWEIDADTNDVFWTENLFELLGGTYDEEPPLEEALDIYHKDDRQIVENAVETALDAGDSFDVEVRFHRPDGELRWLRVQGAPVTEGETVVTLRGTVQDITDQKQIEQELEKEKRRFQTIFEQSNDAIFLLDPSNDAIKNVNPQAEELLGYTRDEFVSSVAISDVHPDKTDQYRAFLDHVQAKGSGRTDRFGCVSKGGDKLECEISASSLNIQGDQLLIANVRDVTERKEYETRLENQNERLEEFASVVSHDLRNPLNVAQGRLELIMDEHESEHLDAIERSHNRMEALIEDLLTLARVGDAVSDTETVELTELAYTCWANVETDTASMTVDTTQTILADRSRLKQVFENLMRNAIEHGGEDVAVTVGTLNDGFYMEDDGPGIPPSDRDEVFKSGYSTNQDGTGFGLHIIEQIIEVHDWTIELTEGSDGGARFEITDCEVPTE